MERVPQSESEVSEVPSRDRSRCGAGSWGLGPAVAFLATFSLVVVALVASAGESQHHREERNAVAIDATVSAFQGGRLRQAINHWKENEAQAPPPPKGGAVLSPPPSPKDVDLDREVQKTWKMLQGSPMKFTNKPRVRREWRTLNDTMKDRVAKAFWAVKTYSTEEGRKKFGANFNNHDDMLILHSCATTDPRCDEGHFGPQFMTFHRALLLKYERSLMSVDPSIEAMPYWNMVFDSQNGKYRNDPAKYIFTDKYFGSYYGTGINHQVIDGLFKNWPVMEWTSERFGNQSYMAKDNKCIREEYFKGTVPSVCDECCEQPQGTCDCDNLPGGATATYTRRVRAHDDCSPHVARYPEDPNALGPLGGSYEIIYNEEDFNICVNVSQVQSWMEWQDCVEMSTFMCSQRFGYISARPGFQQIFVDEILPEMKKRVLLSRDPYFTKALRALEDVGESFSDRFQDTLKKLLKDICGDYMLYGYLRERKFMGQEMSNTLPRFFHSQAHIKFGKDLLDVTTSPNEAAVFTGYHSDIDRSSMTWMMNAQMVNPAMAETYWMYPVNQHITPDQVIKNREQGIGRGISGPFAIYDVFACEGSSSYSEYHAAESPWLPGTLLDDVVNSGFAFKNLFDCSNSDDLPLGITCDGGEKGYTHKEILYWTSPERTEYTYDTLEHFYYDVEKSDSAGGAI